MRRSMMMATAAALLAAPAAHADGLDDYAARAITAPPSSLHADQFYTKYTDAAGIPIVSSPKAPDVALLAARDIVVAMLAERPDIRHALVAAGARVAIMAIDEGTLDLPEQRDWRKPAADDPRLTRCERLHYQERIGRLTDAQYWNQRARGMGGLFTSGAAENLMAVPGTKYFGENIFVHEFSHNILSTIEQVDPLLYGRVERAYAAAGARGLWRGEYGATTLQEYWAEGTQFWFDSNKLAVIDGVRILSDTDLAAYDPALYNVLQEVYRDNHHLAMDVFYNHPARTPGWQTPGATPLPRSTAEVC